ncbi:MAG: hypothetical protein R2683_03030 [Bifidobacterium adolescentis]
MGYVNEDGLRRTGRSHHHESLLGRAPKFMNLRNVQTAFAIRMLFTHRPVDYGGYVLHYHRG